MAVVKFDAFTETDSIRLVILGFPGRSQSRSETILLIPAQQVVEEQLMRAGGVFIGAESWVEVIGRHRNGNRDDARFRRRLRAADRQQQRQGYHLRQGYGG